MSLKFVSLSSGSKGNASLIMSGSTAVLLDAGVAFSKLQAALGEFGLSASDLDGVVVTHEHDDHIRALPKLSSYAKLYVHPQTARAIELRQGYVQNVAPVRDFELGFNIGDIEVYPFRIPHDAAYPLAFSFKCGGARLSVATDIGVPTVGLLKNIKDSELVLLEANHDVDMLNAGNYPPRLKARILSGKGHLSNAAAGRVAQLLSGKSNIKTLLLGHISQNNNREELAYSCVRAALDAVSDATIDVKIARQSARSEVFEIL